MLLHLIRHGETDSNLAGALDTAYPGAPLNAAGRAQAAALPERFAGTTLDAVLTSDLARAIETGAPLAAAHGIEPEALPQWREIQAGDHEMSTDPASLAAFDAAVRPWFAGDLSGAVPGGEDGSTTLARLDAAVARAHDLVGDRGTVAMVGHGAALRLWTVLRTRPAQLPASLLRNTGIITVDGTPATGWSLQDWDT